MPQGLVAAWVDLPNEIAVFKLEARLDEVG
jgi:hypothetical protein